MPKVSIITATYNGEKFIGRAIRSVLWQTFNDWEMIIVDDASSDNTVEIVKNYLKLDNRIKLIQLKENSGGPAIPRTIAFKESKGELIAFIDQDDIFYPEYLELKVDYFEKNPEIEVVFSLAWTFDEESKKIINYEHGGPVNMMVKRKVIEEGEYFKPEQNGVDEIGMLYRYILKNPKDFHKKFVILRKDPITLYSRHPSQGSYVENKDSKKFVKRLESLLSEFTEKKLESLKEKNVKLINEIKNIRFIWYSRLGNFYALAGELKKARECFIRSLKIKFNFFSLFFFFLTFFGFSLYRKIEFYLRQFQRKVIWRLKTFFYMLKYYKSYQKAKEILKKL